MGIIGNIRQKSRVAKLEKHTDALTEFLAPHINIAYLFARPAIEKNVTQWDLENKTLMTFLGYVSGMIVVAERGMYPNSPEALPYREIVFHRVVKNYFSNIPNAAKWLAFSEAGMGEAFSAGRNGLDGPWDQMGAFLSIGDDYKLAFRFGIRDMEVYLQSLSNGQKLPGSPFFGVAVLLNVDIPSPDGIARTSAY